MAFWDSFKKKPNGKTNCPFCHKPIRPSDRHACARMSAGLGVSAALKPEEEDVATDAYVLWCRQCGMGVRTGDMHACTVGGNTVAVPSLVQVQGGDAGLNALWVTKEGIAEYPKWEGGVRALPCGHHPLFAPTQPMEYFDTPESDDKPSPHGTSRKLSWDAPDPPPLYDAPGLPEDDDNGGGSSSSDD